MSMYSFIIDNTKIKSLELSADTKLSNSRYIEADHNNCYGFRSFLNYIEFFNGTKIIKPDIDILSYYENVGFKKHYFRILETHYENGKHIPFFIEQSIAPACFSLEKHLVDPKYNNMYQLQMNIYDKKEYAKLKLQYSK